MTQGFSPNYILDFNEIGPTTDELIPVGTIVNVHMTIRLGGFGPDQTLTKSRGTGVLYLNTMLIVTGGIYALRRIFHRFGIHSYEAENTWVDKGLSQLRAVLESARNISPIDTSDAAQNARKVLSYKDFDGLDFLVKVGIETPKNPQYKKENIVQSIVTPDWQEYAEHKIAENVGIQAAWPFLKRG